MTLVRRTSLLRGGAPVFLAALHGLVGCGPEDSPGESLHFPRLKDMVYVPRDPDPAILIDRFEVTDGDYFGFLEARKSAGDPYEPESAQGFLSHWKKNARGDFLQPTENDLPVRFVSLHDAQAFAAFHGKCLPTRAEWMACGVGLDEHDHPVLPAGLSRVWNTLESGLFAPTPVGVDEFGKTEWGCYDLIGNVAEWTLSESSSERWDGRVLVLGGSFAEPISDRFHRGPGVVRPPTSLYPVQLQHDVGFRLVIPDADAVLSDAMDDLEKLPPGLRAEAIDELLLVGEHRQGRNAILPVVAEREFLSRVRWAISLGAAKKVMRSPARLHVDRADGSEDLLVLVRGGAGDPDLHKLYALHGRDGRVILEVDLPRSSLSGESGVLNRGDTEAWFWTELSLGRLALVHLPDARVRIVDLPRADNEVSMTIEPRASGGGDVLIFESLEQFDQPSSRTRVVRLTSGDSLEIFLPGRWLFTRDIDDETFLLLTQENPPPERELEQGPCVARLVRTSDLSIVRETRFPFREPSGASKAVRLYSELATSSMGSGDGSVRVHWMDQLEIVLPRLPFSRQEITLVSPPPLCLNIWDLRLEAGPLSPPGQAGFFAQESVFMFQDRALLVDTRRHDEPPSIEAWPGVFSDVLTPDTEEPRNDFAPLLVVNREVATDWMLHAWVDEQGEPEPVEIVLDDFSAGELKWVGYTRRPSPKLIIVSTTGETCAVDLCGRGIVWRQKFGSDGLSGHRILQASRSGESPWVMGNPTDFRRAFRCWFRSLKTGLPVPGFEEIEVRHLPLRTVEMLDLDGRGERVPVVIFGADQRSGAPPQQTLAAIGPPKHQAAALLREFQERSELRRLIRLSQ